MVESEDKLLILEKARKIFKNKVTYKHLISKHFDNYDSLGYINVKKCSLLLLDGNLKGSVVHIFLRKHEDLVSSYKIFNIEYEKNIC